jgi:hypothetical protein
MCKLKLLCASIHSIIIYFFRSGGVELFVQKGKIKVENTLEARLEMLSYQVRFVFSPESLSIQFAVADAP